MPLITTAELAAHLGVDEADLDATQAEQAVTLVSDYIVDFCGRPFAATADATYTVYSPGAAVVLPHTNVSVSSVTVDGVAVDAADFRVDEASGLLYRVPAWWWEGEVVVTYDHDSDTVPGTVKLAALMLAAKAVENPEGLSSETIGNYAYTIKNDESGLSPAEMLALHRTPVVA